MAGCWAPRCEWAERASAISGAGERGALHDRSESSGTCRHQRVAMVPAFVQMTPALQSEAVPDSDLVRRSVALWTIRRTDRETSTVRRLRVERPSGEVLFVQPVYWNSWMEPRYNG